MSGTRESCKCCGGPTIPDPGHNGQVSSGLYCPACDAVWSEAVCVVCEDVYLVDCVRHRGGHHCDPAVERRFEAGRRRHSSLGRMRGHTEGERLKDGFRMLGGDR